MPNGYIKHGSNGNKAHKDSSVGHQLQDRNRIVIEPSEEQRTARDVEIQQRGGYLHDTIKIDPYSKGYKPLSRKKSLVKT